MYVFDVRVRLIDTWWRAAAGRGRLKQLLAALPNVMGGNRKQSAHSEHCPSMAQPCQQMCYWNSYLVWWLLRSPIGAPIKPTRCTWTEVAQWLGRCATNWKVAGSIPAGVTVFFIDIKSFRSHYGPGVDWASNRNEYQEHFLEGKCGLCVRLTTLPPSCAVVTKSGNLNLLEPFGPLQACNGTALPFFY